MWNFFFRRGLLRFLLNYFSWLVRKLLAWYRKSGANFFRRLKMQRILNIWEVFVGTNNGTSWFDMCVMASFKREKYFNKLQSEEIASHTRTSCCSAFSFLGACLLMSDLYICDKFMTALYCFVDKSFLVRIIICLFHVVSRCSENPNWTSLWGFSAVRFLWVRFLAFVLVLGRG